MTLIKMERAVCGYMTIQKIEGFEWLKLDGMQNVAHSSRWASSRPMLYSISTLWLFNQRGGVRNISSMKSSVRGLYFGARSALPRTTY